MTRPALALVHGRAPSIDDDGGARGRLARQSLLDLAGALEREAQLAVALRDALVRQREAVAASRADDVNESVEAIGRILLTMEEARRARAATMTSLCGDAPPPIDRLGEALGVTPPAELVAAGRALERAAREVVREVGINREVLRRAVEAGESFLQALFSTVDASCYRAPAAEETPLPGLLLDRRA